MRAPDELQRKVLTALQKQFADQNIILVIGTAAGGMSVLFSNLTREQAATELLEASESLIDELIGPPATSVSTGGYIH